MPTTSSIAGSLKKPFSANKRLFTLLTVAFVVIGIFFALYYSHIKNNEHHFRESKLQGLDSSFDIIRKQLDNDFQKVNSQKDSKGKGEAIKKETGSKNTAETSKDTAGTTGETNTYAMVWNGIKKSDLNSIFENEFDDYIVIFKDVTNSPKKDSNATDQKEETGKKDQAKKDETELFPIKEISSLKGRVMLPDTLDQMNPFNIGLSTGIPENDPKFQLFGREYSYTTNLDESVEYEITIIGLIETERYYEVIRKLDPWIISLLTTFLLLGLFGLPYFKMLFVAEDERLSSDDVILSGISVVLGAPIIMTVFLSTMNHYHDYYHKVPEQLSILSGQIRERFEEENRDNVTQLYTMLLEEAEERAKADTINISQMESAVEAPLRNNLKFFSKIKENGEIIYHIAYINNSGIENTKNLSKRPYYRDFVTSENLWFLDTLNKEIKYVMRPVVSIEGQTEEAVYILKNEMDSIQYRVGASQLKSVHEPILPFGFQFAIVDGTGEVWFHSKKGRATLENFFDVSRNNERLKSAISGRINASGKLTYHDEGKLYGVTPLQGTNLSVITLYDIGLLRTQISEILTLSCIALIIAFALMLIITVLSLIVKNPKLGLYKYDRFIFDFLTPKKNNRNSYILLSMLFSGMLTIALIFNIFIDLDPPNVFILCLLLGIYTYLIVFYTFHPYRNRKEPKFIVRNGLLFVVIIFLNLIMYKVNVHNDDTNGLWLVFLPTVLVQSVFIFIIVRGQIHKLPEKVWKICRYNILKLNISYRDWYAIFLFSWLVLATVFPAFLIFQNAKSLNDAVWNKMDQIHMARQFLDKEKVLEKNLPKFDGPEKEKAFSTLYENHLKKGLYHDIFQVTRNAEDTIKDVTKDVPKDIEKDGSKDGPGIVVTDPVSKPDDDFLGEFLWNARPVYDQRISQFLALVYSHAEDASWISNEANKRLTVKYLDHRGSVEASVRPPDNVLGEAIVKRDAKTENDTVGEMDTAVEGDTTTEDDSATEKNSATAGNKKGSESTGTTFKRPKEALMFKALRMIGTFLILVILFSLILFFSDRIFAFRFRHLTPNDFDRDDKGGYVKKFSQILLDENSNSGLLLIGLPFSGKRSFTSHILDNAGYTKVANLSMLQLEDVNPNATIPEMLNVLSGHTTNGNGNLDWENKEAFVIEHLEHNIKSFDANHIKLRIILFLISKRKRIILVSEVYPSQIFAIYEDAGPDSDHPQGSLQDDFNSWRNILSAFPQVLIGITENHGKVSHRLKFGLEKDERPDEDAVAILTEELGYSKFLPTLAPIVMSKTQYRSHPDDIYSRLDRQRMVMHTQNLAHGYYNDIWNALPTRERYLLYDLAKDSFLNIKNRNSLFSLMKKGLIVWRDRPAIFNYSFKNFIITSVSLNEALRLEHKNRGKSTWANTRILIYLVIITAIVFIALGKPELLNDFEALIGTLGGLGVVIPLVSKLLASGGQKL